MIRYVISWGLSILSLEGLWVARCVVGNYPLKSLGLERIFAETDKVLLKFIWKCKRRRRTKTILIKEQSWRTFLSQF